MKKVVCNKCGSVFDEDNIPLLIEWEDGFAEILGPDSWRKPGGESFYGCPHCLTDSYLMDEDD